MAKTAQPFTLIRRSDSKSYRLTLNPSCGLSDRVCREWYRRNFQHLSAELANYRNPKLSKNDSEAKAAAYALIQHRRNLVNYLLPEYGKTNSCRNTILFTLKLVMQEAKREGIIDMVPEFEPFKRSSKIQNVLSGGELDALFPDNERDLISVWKRPDDMRKERDETALMFGTLFCVAVSAGMRSGEIRAMFAEQVSLANSGLVIDRAVDERGVIGLLKKGTEEDPRSRAVIIPDKSLKVLERWMDRTPKCSEFPGLVFPYRNKIISASYIFDRFRYGLDNLGIDHEKRRLTVHCLRYTYNTRMKTSLPGEVLREFLRHRSVGMTDHYDNLILLERLLALQDMRSKVEQFWSKAGEKPEEKKVLEFKVS